MNEETKPVPLGTYATGHKAVMDIRPDLMKIQEVPALNVNETILIMTEATKKLLPAIRETGKPFREALKEIRITFKRSG